MLIALMALVTGSMVGGAVRFAAGNSQGWGPGLLAAFIGLGAIMGGKVGAFAVAGNIFLDDNTWSVEDELADATTDDAMIGGIAGLRTKWTKWTKWTRNGWKPGKSRKPR